MSRNFLLSLTASGVNASSIPLLRKPEGKPQVLQLIISIISKSPFCGSFGSPLCRAASRCSLALTASPKPSQQHSTWVSLLLAVFDLLQKRQDFRFSLFRSQPTLQLGLAPLVRFASKNSLTTSRRTSVLLVNPLDFLIAKKRLLTSPFNRNRMSKTWFCLAIFSHTKPHYVVFSYIKFFYKNLLQKV